MTVTNDTGNEYAPTQIHTCTHTPHACAHTHIHTYTHTLSLSPHTSTHKYTHGHARTHACMHTHTHMHTYDIFMHTYTHTKVHTLSRITLIVKPCVSDVSTSRFTLSTFLFLLAKSEHCVVWL